MTSLSGTKRAEKDSEPGGGAAQVEGGVERAAVSGGRRAGGAGGAGARAARRVQSRTDRVSGARRVARGTHSAG